jgi:hypothetical protein
MAGHSEGEVSDLAQIVAGPAQQRIDRIAFNAFKEVACQSAVRPHVPDHRLHRISALVLAVDVRCQPAPAPGNPEFQVGRGATMAMHGVNLCGLYARDPLRLLDTHLQRRSVIRIARQKLGTGDKAFLLVETISTFAPNSFYCLQALCGS